MPQPVRPARLAWDATRDTYVIRDVGNVRRRLGLGRDQRAAAEEALSEYVRAKAAAARAEPVIGGTLEQTSLATVIAYYCTHHAPTTKRPEEVGQKCTAILTGFGPIMLSGIHGLSCRKFAKGMDSQSYARECLSTLRAAIRLYALDCQLRGEVKIWTPPKSQPRQDWLTKAEVRALILTAWREKDSQVRMVGPEGAKVPRTFVTTRRRWSHLIPFLVVGIWTSTRTGRVQPAPYKAMPGRPWVDLRDGDAFYNRTHRGEVVADNKKAPDVPLSAQLAKHMRSWARDKTVRGKVRPGNVYVVQYAGRPANCAKAFRECYARAVELFPDLFRHEDGTVKRIVRHTLRHTGITWRAQAGQNPLDICHYAGLSLDTFDKHYSHACPGHLKGIA